MSRRNSSSKKRTIAGIIFGLIIIALIAVLIGVTIIIEKRKPSTEVMELDEYYDFSSDKEAIIILNNTICTERARLKDGKVYLSHSFIKENLNSRFYYDSNENIFMYTTADEVIRTTPGTMDITAAGNTSTLGYTVCYQDGDEIFVALDFVKEYTGLEYTFEDSPNRLIAFSKSETYNCVSVTEDTVIRYRGGIKSPILEEVFAGDTFEVIDREENWTKVVSHKGVMGYIEKKYLGEEESADRVIADLNPVIEHNLLPYKVSLGWHQVTNLQANEGVTRIVSETKGMNVISPTWFYLDDNQGNIANLSSAEYVNYCHQNNIQVWGLISNLENTEVSTTDVLNTTSIREKLEIEIIQAALKVGMDGVNIDFESLSAEAGASFVQFIREMSILCRQNNLILSVDNYVPSEFSRMYNRTEQGIFADYVILMAYDEHYVGSDEGPVASIGFVRDGIQNTLREGVSSEQLILGIPFYSRVWCETPKDETGDDVASASEGYVPYELSSKALGMEDSAANIANNGATAVWNEEDGLYYAEYEKEGNTYKIWLENAQSIALKLDEMTNNNLAGAAFWKLELEDPAIWDTICTYIN